MESGKYIAAAIITLILQLLICEFVNIWPGIYITVLPLFIILLPLSLSVSWLMIAAFAMGLATDAFADGVLGLNAASLTLVAYLKYFITRRLTKYQEESMAENLQSLRTNYTVMFLLILFSYALFFLAYTLLDGEFNTSRLVVGFFLNVALNTLIAYILDKLWVRKLL